MAWRALPDVFQQTFTVNGQAAVGYVLKAYLYNTTTPTPVATNAAGTGQATSFALNSRGAPASSGGTEVSLFLNTEITTGYKFVLENDSGDVVRTYDGPVFAPPTTGDIDALNAESMAYTPPGGTATNVAAFLDGIGIYADAGYIDLQTAIDQAIANDSSLILKRDYVLTAGVDFDSVHIVGRGYTISAATDIYCTVGSGARIYGINFDGVGLNIGDDHEDIKIRRNNFTGMTLTNDACIKGGEGNSDVYIQHNKATTIGPQSHAAGVSSFIRIYTANDANRNDNIVCEYNELDGIYSRDVFGIWLRRCDNSIIRNNRCRNIHGYNIYSYNMDFSDNCQIVGNYTDPESYTLENLGFDDDGLYVVSAIGSRECNDIVIANNNVGSSIKIPNPADTRRNIRVAGNTVMYLGDQMHRGGGIEMDGDNVHITIQGNTVVNGRWMINIGQVYLGSTDGTAVDEEGVTSICNNIGVNISKEGISIGRPGGIVKINNNSISMRHDADPVTLARGISIDAAFPSDATIRQILDISGNSISFPRIITSSTNNHVGVYVAAMQDTVGYNFDNQFSYPNADWTGTSYYRHYNLRGLTGTANYLQGTFNRPLDEAGTVAFDSATFGYFLNSPVQYIENASVGAPAGGRWTRGQKLVNLTPSASGVEGLICTSSGTPGTWKNVGVIAA